VNRCGDGASLGPACPRCGGRVSKVLKTRDGGSRIVRRRECHGCGSRFTSDEAPLYPDLRQRFVRLERRRSGARGVVK
jgi:transcriptional regulator NrdR family protein